MLVTTSVHDGESSLHRSARQDQIRLPHHHGRGKEVIFSTPIVTSSKKQNNFKNKQYKYLERYLNRYYST